MQNCAFWRLSLFKIRYAARLTMQLLIKKYKISGNSADFARCGDIVLECGSYTGNNSCCLSI